MLTFTTISVAYAETISVYKTDSFYTTNLKDIALSLAIMAVPLYVITQKKPNTSSASFIISLLVASFAAIILFLASLSLVTGVISDLYTLSLTKPFYSTLFVSIIALSVVYAISYFLRNRHEKARIVMTLSLCLLFVLAVLTIFWLLEDYQSHTLALLFLGFALTIISAFGMSGGEGGCCLPLCFGLVLMLISGAEVFFTYPLFSTVAILIVTALLILYQLNKNSR